MKIVFVTNLFEPYARGGAERIVKQLAEEQIKRGNEVTVITTRPFGCSRDGQLTVPIVISFFPWNLYFVGNDFKYPAFIRFFWHIFDTFNIHSYFKIKKILRKIEPDLVWTHNLKGIGFLTPLAIRSLKLKHIHTLHDVQLVIPSGLLLYGEENHRKNRNFLIRMYSFITKKLFGSPDEVFSPSEWLLNFYKERGFFKKSKCEVRRNPIFHHVCKLDTHKTCHPEERSDEGSSERSERSLCSLDPSAATRLQDDRKQQRSVRFLFVGQIEKHKGIFFLVQTWKEMNRSVELVVIGGGSYEEELKKEIISAPKIKYLGKLPYEKVQEWYQKTDALIFPSLCYENSPNVIHEALHFGLPIIASNLGSIPEFIKEGENGFLFTPGDKDSFLCALEKFQNSKTIIFPS